MRIPGRHPTILVPGFAGGTMPFRPFRDELRARGVDADGWERAPVLYRRPIAWYAARLAASIRARPDDGLTLVGWSMGGFVSVAAALDTTVWRRVRRIITFGTPWNGTWAARLGLLADPILRLNVREMRPGSPVVHDLVDALHGPRPWDFHAVNGTLDLLARAPMRRLRPEWCHTGPWWHRSLLWDSNLFDLIHRLIT
ncbi:MAG TPA: alpha/beta hydrolase, partial [Patescibacteria group bacterium]|nr:alpha/beta hydrolase [Patescibacteria group bacterium]